MNRRALLGLVSVICGSGCLSRPPTLEPDTHATLFVRGVPLDTGHLEHLGFKAATREHVAGDYGRLIAFAKHELELSEDTATVLVGFSRGSGLAVVAAGQPELQPLLGGVLGVALTDEEEYVHEHRTRAGRDRRDVSARELATLRPYDQLARLNRLPVEVIQSTEDSYLPAARARQLFGPDDERRRFHAIHAGSHTFAGARDALYEQARVALEWIMACRSSAEPAETRSTQWGRSP